MPESKELLAVSALMKVRARRVEIRQLQLAAADRQWLVAREHEQQCRLSVTQAEYARHEFETLVFKKLAETGGSEMTLRVAMFRLKALALDIVDRKGDEKEAQADSARLEGARILAQEGMAQSVRSEFKAKEMETYTRAAWMREKLRKEDSE